MGYSTPAILPLFILFTLISLPTSLSIYCDEDDCYDLLGVTQSATSSEIKKAYYKLSLKLHPDKNPDPESNKIFVKVATAYEILKDEATREQYDYALAHPEEDPRAVLFGFLLFVSALQYVNQHSRYSQAVSMVKKTPAYKNKLRALELEHNKEATRKKKGSKQIIKKAVEEDYSGELELQIQGVEKPSLWKLLVIQLVLLPYTLAKLSAWYICWFWRYNIKKAPYSLDDACYLTRKALKVTLHSWQAIDEFTQQDLIERRLWKKNNMDAYLVDMKKESKRRR